MLLLLWQQHEKFRVRPRGSALIPEMKLEQIQTKAFLYIINNFILVSTFALPRQVNLHVHAPWTVSETRPQTFLPC